MSPANQPVFGGDSIGNTIIAELASQSPDLNNGPFWKKTHSSRVSEARETVSKAITRHSLELADPDGAFDFKSWTARISTTTLSDFTYLSDSDLRISVADDERDCYFIIIPISGRGQVLAGGRQMPMTPGFGLMFGPTGRLDFIDSPPYWRNLDIRLNRQRFEDYVARQTRTPLRAALEFEKRPISLSEEGVALLRFIQYLISECTSSQPIFQNGSIATNLEQTLFGVVLESMAFVDRATLPGESEHNRLSKLVMFAERFITDHFTEDLNITSIADATYSKPRSLHNAFNTFRGYTPLQFLRACRLNHARGLLKASHPHETTVTEVALDSGFMHLSKFAAAYKRRFGESPSITLRMVADR